MSKDKKSILEEAANDLTEIVEAAKKQAKDNLAKELPEQFDTLLNEELNKISSKKESVSESVKDIKKESVKDEKLVGKESINEELDMRDFSMEEVEEAFDQAQGGEEFAIAPPEEDFSVERIAQAIDNAEGMEKEKEAADLAVEAVNADPYTKFKEMYENMGQMVKEMEDQKMHEEYGAAFESSMSGIYGESFRESLGDDKCNELYEMFVQNKKGEPFGKEGGAVNEEKEDKPFEQKSDPSTEQGESIAEQKEQGGKQNYKGRENGGPTTEMIKEDDIVTEEETEIEVKGDEVEIEVGGEDEKDEEREEGKDVDENLVNTHAAQRKVQGGHNPNIDVAGKHRDGRTRSAKRSGGVSEAYQKRMESLIAENKKLTKEVNEAKKSFGKAEQLVESYKTHLEKYRNQLREMAVFNTNLANVNNLLVNEELALTTEDKLSIVNKFKGINSIVESDNTYGNLITEMKEGKKAITEVEDKVSTSVGESSKQVIDEAIERTAYENNDHVNKIKNLMKYVDSK